MLARVAFQLETIWWWNRLFLFHWPPTVAIRVPAGQCLQWSISRL